MNQETMLEEIRQDNFSTHITVSVCYRNGFRIRPLGDAEFDWLQLNKRRVQNPSLCIRSDQVLDMYRLSRIIGPVNRKKCSGWIQRK